MYNGTEIENMFAVRCNDILAERLAVIIGLLHIVIILEWVLIKCLMVEIDRWKLRLNL